MYFIFMYLAISFAFIQDYASGEACVSVPQGKVVIKEECADVLCPEIMDSGLKVSGNWNALNTVCVTNSDHGLKIWKCEAGTMFLQSGSITCEGVVTDCVVGDETPRCEQPSWCEPTLNHPSPFCEGDAVLVWKWKANGCRDDFICVEKSSMNTNAIVPEAHIVPTEIPLSTTMGNSSATELNGTLSSIFETTGVIFELPESNQEFQDYDLEFLWPLILIVILPPIYLLIMRTHQCDKFKRMLSIGLQLAIVSLIVYALFTCSDLLHDIIQEIRESIGHWGLSYILMTYCGLQMIRYFVPPLYFCFPLDTVFIAVMLLSTPLYQAVLIWQTITCIVCIFGFFVLRFLYSDWAKRALESDDVEYFKDIRNLLKVFNDHWESRFENASVFWQCVYISSFFNAEFFSHYIGLFWTAVRNPLKKKVCSSDLTFVCSCIIGFILELPASLVQFRLISNAIDSLEQSRFQMFKEFQWYELLPYVVLTGTATCIVQFHNLYAVVKGLQSLCCSFHSKDDLEPTRLTMHVI